MHYWDKFYEVENSTLLVGIELTSLNDMPSALTSELWECHRFQFIVWDTGSGDIDILFYDVNIQNIYANERAIFVFIASISYRLIRELCNKGKLATMCRNWDGFVPMLPASDRFWLGCGALWHMCGRENIGVIVLVFRISRYLNSLFRILYYVISFSVYAYAAVYPSLSRKAPDNAYPYRYTVGLHCAVWRNRFVSVRYLTSVYVCRVSYNRMRYWDGIGHVLVNFPLFAIL